MREGLCFNTQPPEGGWTSSTTLRISWYSFNTQPPEGGWRSQRIRHGGGNRFNTQPPEGGWFTECAIVMLEVVSTHSRPKAAGHGLGKLRACCISFNTQPPEGGWSDSEGFRLVTIGFNTQPPEGGWFSNAMLFKMKLMFQHTAARRRLDVCDIIKHSYVMVSTHSRPKAAGSVPAKSLSKYLVSTHSRPKAAG